MLAALPAALRAFARMRHELRGGVLPAATRERIALAVAEERGDAYSIAQHARTARGAGLGLDEISRARSWSSGDPREAALLSFLKALFEADGRPAHHLLEEAREVGWSDEELLEAVAHVALNEFQSLMANARPCPRTSPTRRLSPPPPPPSPLIGSRSRMAVTPPQLGDRPGVPELNSPYSERGAKSLVP